VAVAACERAFGIDELSPCQFGELPPCLGEGGMAHDPGGRRGRDAVALEQITRQIDPPDPGILVDVARDVGEL
jgi:hypothetical protein